MRSVPPVLRSRLVETTGLSDDTLALTFAAVEGSFLGCEPGAHIDVHLPDGVIRNYSLTGWSSDQSTVSVAVKIETNGRGGSRAMHGLEIGGDVDLSQPRNNFALRPTDPSGESPPIVLIGGGIGITPLLAMSRSLRAAGTPFTLHYLTRTRAAAAFDRELLTLDLGEDYRLHCDDEHGIADFSTLLADCPAGTHFYVCGPEVMLKAVQKVSKELSIGTVFFERFSALPDALAGDGDGGGRTGAQAFQVVLDSTGAELNVPADKSVLSVLREAGHDLAYSCSEGVCGSCIVDVLDGEIDHRDSFLTDEECAAGDCMTICVSRARGKRLVLDL